MARPIAQQGDFDCRDGSKELWHLRVSSRAKYARITYSAREGLVVTVPSRSRLDPERILEANRPQVERMIARMHPHRAAFVEGFSAPLPRKLEFLTAGEIWDVRYEERDSSRVITRVGDGELSLVGPSGEKAAFHRALSSFTLNRAKIALPELVSLQAQEFDISYTSCRVSMAHSRWGSCSARGDIMLSAQLMFLPPELGFHVICHELAHTRHHNHSASFHAHLRTLDPDASVHAKQLKGASALVPAWMFKNAVGTPGNE